MRVLVTGSSGFIGSHVTRHLVQQGHDVHAVIRNPAAAIRVADLLPQINVIPTDLCRADRIRRVLETIRPETAIHLAWYAEPGKFWTAPENADSVGTTMSLVTALSSAGCKRLIVAGSCAEYDWQAGTLTESGTPLRPLTLYGVCKDATRRILEPYCAQQLIALSWARLFFVYGPGEARQRLVPSIVTALLRGEEAHCSHGTQVRDYLHVDDVASAIAALATGNIHGPVNVASGTGISIRELVTTIARKLGREDLVRVGLRQSQGTEAPFIVASTDRLRHELQWQPRFDLDSGLDDTIDWWRSQPSQG